jgi:hypothetical protein
VLALLTTAPTRAAEETRSNALQVQITTCPDQAQVSIDGRLRGRTPRSLSGLDDRAHTITLSKDGYQERSVVVVGSGGSNQEIALPLVPTAVYAQAGDRNGLLIAACPEDASIFVDDVWRGNGAAFVPDLAAGVHDVLIARSGYEVTRRLATVVEGKRVRVDEVLVPGLDMPPVTGAGAQLVVDTCPARASVVVDGSQRGESPIVLDVEPGQHEVVVALAGHRGRHEIVAVPAEARRELRLALHLEPPPTTGEALSTISVASCPTGAAIHLGGFRKGRTPAIVRAYPGPVNLEVRAPAGGTTSPSARQVTVQRGQMAIAEFDFSGPAPEGK